MNEHTPLARLRAVIRGYESAATAFSAGIDSTLVAVVAQQELGAQAVAVTSASESLAPSELADAQRLARELGLRHHVLRTDELRDPRYASNPVDRCYFCKTHLYEALAAYCRERGLRYVLNGLNLDDAGDWRPGAVAAAEREELVRSPLVEAGFDKATIRAVARDLGIPTWGKPALACLSSRIPYGSEVTEAKLRTIEAAEQVLRDLGFRVFRVRHHDTLARIEVARDEMPRALEPAVAEQLVRGIKAAGYAHVTIDLQGYRLGSLNEALRLRPVQ